MFVRARTHSFLIARRQHTRQQDSKTPLVSRMQRYEKNRELKIKNLTNGRKRNKKGKLYQDIRLLIFTFILTRQYQPPHFLSPKHTLLQTHAVVIMTLQKGQNRHRDAWRNINKKSIKNIHPWRLNHPQRSNNEDYFLGTKVSQVWSS